jgi:hydroxymethylpyrimidine/phosphomethylpyrimidine kinase
MPDAVALAERYIRRAVAASYPLGAGTGPVSPLWAVREWWTETS